MEGITRRNFVKKSGVVAALATNDPLKTLQEIELNLDWGAAIEENDLRNEVSGFMKEMNFEVVYHRGSETRETIRRVNYKQIAGFDMPIRKLREIKKHLNAWEHFARKYPGKGLIQTYSYKDSSVGGVSHISSSAYLYNL